MKEYMSKEFNKAKRVRIALIILSVINLIFLFVIPLSGLAPETFMPIWVWVMIATIILALVYYNKFQSVVVSINRLNRKEMADIGNDIDINSPSLPLSNIYCGKKAFAVKKPFMVIPYSDVAWIYKRITKAYGLLTLRSDILIKTVYGKTFTVRPDDKELEWLINNRIAVNSPNLIIGFSPDRQKLYKKLNPEIAVKNKKTLRTAGISILSFGLLIALAAFINNPARAPQIPIMWIIPLVGVILYIIGARK